MPLVSHNTAAYRTISVYLLAMFALVMVGLAVWRGVSTEAIVAIAGFAGIFVSRIVTFGASS